MHLDANLNCVITLLMRLHVAKVNKSLPLGLCRDSAESQTAIHHIHLRSLRTAVDMTDFKLETE